MRQDLFPSVLVTAAVTLHLLLLPLQARCARPPTEENGWQTSPSLAPGSSFVEKAVHDFRQDQSLSGHGYGYGYRTHRSESDLLSVDARGTVLLSGSMASAKATSEEHSRLVQTQRYEVEQRLAQDRKELKEAQELERSLAAQVAKLEEGRTGVQHQMSSYLSQAAAESEKKVSEGFASAGEAAEEVSSESGSGSNDEAGVPQGLAPTQHESLIQGGGWLPYSLLQEREEVRGNKDVKDEPDADIFQPLSGEAEMSEEEYDDVANKLLDVRTQVAYERFTLHRLQQHKGLLHTMLEATKAEKAEVERGIKLSILAISETKAKAAKAAKSGRSGGESDSGRSLDEEQVAPRSPGDSEPVKLPLSDDDDSLVVKSQTSHPVLASKLGSTKQSKADTAAKEHKKGKAKTKCTGNCQDQPAH